MMAMQSVNAGANRMQAKMMGQFHVIFSISKVGKSRRQEQELGGSVGG